MRKIVLELLHATERNGIGRGEFESTTAAPCRYVAAGDSNTQQNEEQRVYARLLVERDARRFGFLRNAGRGGWDTRRLLVLIQSAVLQYEPTVVSIMLGTNDHRIEVGASLPRATVAEFEANYRAILAALPGIRIVLMTPPFVADRSDPAHARTLNARLLPYAEVVRALGRELRWDVVDVHEITTALGAGSSQQWTNGFTVGDGVHMNAAAHEAVYAALRPVLFQKRLHSAEAA